MAEPPADAGVGFRVLVVCAGNVCRSPLAERLIRARLAAALGRGAGRFQVTSAGTNAVAGTAMDPRAAAVARRLGANPDGFRARPLTSDLVVGVDLVLTATREHRAAVVRLHPPAHRFTFTLREFGRLVGSIPVGDRPAGADPAARAAELVAAARVRRGTVRPGRPEDDDVPDPHGTVDRVHHTVGDLVEAALAVPLEIVCGIPGMRPATPVRPSRRALRKALRRLRRSASRRGRRSTVRSGDRPRRRLPGLPARWLGGPRLGGAQPPPEPAGPGWDRRGRGHPGPPLESPPPARWRGLRRVRVPWLRRPGHPPLRPAVRVAAAAVLLLLTATGWLAIRGLAAERELIGARADLGLLRDALLAADPDRARVALADARRRTARAHALTDDVVWRLAGLPPYLGNAPRAVRTLAAVVDRVTSRALSGLVDAGEALTPDRLRPSGDTVAVDAFARARPDLDAAAAEIALARARLDDLDSAWLPRPVGAALHDTRAELAATASTVDSADRATRLVPAMLGGQRPRRYLVVFQNNAEARGTGGLPGLYAVLAVDRGRLRVERLGSNTDLHSAPRLPVDLGPEYTAQWGQDPALWPNSNLDPSFPNAARIWLALWQRQTGQRLDGAVATDPVAVSYLLGAVGPVRLPGGERVDAGDVVQLTMSDVYRRYSDSGAQNAFLRVVAGRAIETLLASRGRPAALLDGLVRAARERRLLVYSADRAEEQDLAATAVGGRLPDAGGPYAFLVVNNLAGSKMDYYLQRSLSYSAGQCVGGQRASRIVIRLGNTAPPAGRLPDYVTRRGDTSAGTLDQSAAPGSVVILVSMYGARGAGVLRSVVDGTRLAVTSHLVDGRPVWGFPLVVTPGQWRTLVLDLVEPASGAAPVVPVQPLVRPEVVQTSIAPC